MSRWLCALASLALMGAQEGCAHRAPWPAQDSAWTQLPPIPDPVGVAGSFAGSSHGALLVAGGANFPNGMPWDGGQKAWHDAVYVLERPDGVWKTAGRLPRALAYGVSVQGRDGVLCIGGNDAEHVYGDSFELAWVHGRLHTRTLPPLPIPAVSACGARVGSLVFVAGGETEPGTVEAASHCWSLDLDAVDRGWQARTAWPGEGRTLAVAASLEGEFYVVGGVALSAGPDGKPFRRYLRDGYAFDPKKSAWRRIADMPHPFAASPTPAPAIGNRRFAIPGGDDGALYGFQPLQQHPGFCSDVLGYDAHANAWAVMGHVPAPRATLPAVLWRDRVVLPSGEERPGVRSPQVWAWRAEASP